MLKKKRTLLLMLPLMVMLAACAGLKLPGTSASTGSAAQPAQGQNQPGQPPDMTNQPIEQKLALGTLKLEGTNQAVTAEQAKALLPLWKAVKTMSTNSSASTEEINGLYQQIQETMTSDQVQAIKDLSLKQEDLQALMKQYNIQAPQMGPGMFNGTPGVRRTPGAQSGNRTGGNSGGQAGGPGFGPGDMGGGMPPDGGFPGGMPGGNAQNSGQQQNPQGTPQARRNGFRGGMNTMFIDPLIKLLQERAGIQVTPTAQ